MLLVLVGLVVGLIIATSSPAPPTDQGKGIPVGTTGTFNGGFPLNIFSRVAVLNDELDRLYNQGQTALTNKQFRDAITNLEQLRDRQNQTSATKYKDVSTLLVRSYVGLGDQLGQSAQFKDFQESLVYLRKAVDLSKTLPAPDRDQQQESSLQTRLDKGGIYEQAVTAYNQQQWEAAAPIFKSLYTKDQNYRNASSLYYDTLIKVGDIQAEANQLPEAYLSFARAASLKNVADTRYAQARVTTIENQLRQAGKPVPTLPAS